MVTRSHVQLRHVTWDEESKMVSEPMTSQKPAQVVLPLSCDWVFINEMFLRFYS